MIQEGNLIKDLPQLSDVPVHIDRIERSIFSSQVERQSNLFSQDRVRILLGVTFT